MSTKKTLTNIFLIGPMGAGKTSVGKALAKKLNKTFYDSDEEIEKRTGVSLNWIVDLEGMQGYRQREMQILDQLSSLENIILSTGGGCVETEEVREFLQTRGIVVYMEVALPTQMHRLKRDKKRPMLQKDDRNAVLTELWEKREPYYEQIADFSLLTDGRSVNDVADEILKWIERL